MKKRFCQDCFLFFPGCICPFYCKDLDTSENPSCKMKDELWGEFTKRFTENFIKQFATVKPMTLPAGTKVTYINLNKKEDL